MRNLIAILSLSLSVVHATPGFAGGMGIILDYYEKAFDSLIQAGDQAAYLEFMNLVSDIGTRTELIQSDIGYSSSGNPDYLKTIVDGILGDNPEYYTGGRGYLYNWGTISNGLKSINSSIGVIGIADALKNIGVSTSNFNEAAKEIAALTARGDSRAVSWLFAVAEAGYYGGSAQLSLLDLSNDTTNTLKAIFADASAADIEKFSSTLRQDASFYASNEYRNLMLDDDGRRVIVQQLVIQYLSDTSPNIVNNLKNQNMYTVQFVDRWWPFRNTYSGSIVSGSDLFQDFTFDSNFSYELPWTPSVTIPTNPTLEIELVTPPNPIIDISNGSDNNHAERIDEVKIGIPENNIPEEPVLPTPPTGPTPEEIAEAERLAQEEADRQAELERQQLEAERLEAERQRQAAIAALEDERDRQFLVKLDAEARLRNNNNRLAILEFDERERVQNVLSVVNTEAARLRGELNSTGLSDADSKRLQDIMRYGEVLEGELDRIATEETSLRTRNAEFQQALDAANATIVRNSNQLNALNYDWNQYTVPTISVVLPDWSNYEYELPPFDQTDAPTTDLRNAVVSSVSLPVTTGTIRNGGTLVSEDGEDTRFDTFGVSESQSEKLDDFNHLFIGRNSAGLQWIYGEASTPEQFALRTGTATFRGGLSGYYAHGSIDSNTVYQDSVFGSLTLNIDFGSNLLTGEGSLEIDNVARREEISFQISPASIAENNDGLSRSLRFASNATLLNGVAGNGNFSGAFYGLDASEAAGSFAFNLDGGFAAGLWAAGENYVPRDDESRPSLAYVIGYSAREDGYGTAWDEGEKISATRLNYFNGDGDDSVDIASTLPSESFSFVSWGTWIENSSTRDALGNAGYWLHVDPVTSPAIVENRTGTAQYGGEIIGGYVSSGSIRQNAQGIISLTANFADQSIGGQFQFGRDCSGSGLSGCSVASEVQSFNEAINDYDGSGFGNFERTGSSGVVGVFAGDNAQEIGGHAWLTENQGMYIGVFRAREGLSFGSFVTPTSDQGQSIDYTNYRGLLAYRGFEAEPDLFAELGEPVSGFVGVQSVSDTGDVAFNNSNLTRSAAHSSTDTHGTYSYVTWGEWDSRSAGSVFTIDGQSVDQGRGNWLVYDPTTDLPTSGSASYQGSVDGAGSVAGGIVRGGINLEADFGSDRITGSMSLRDGNNSSWADAAFDAPITRSTDSSGFQGGLTGANVDSGTIFGGFAGPNAEEVGGGWQIDHVNGSDANGIFRAQQ